MVRWVRALVGLIVIGALVVLLVLVGRPIILPVDTGQAELTPTEVALARATPISVSEFTSVPTQPVTGALPTLAATTPSVITTQVTPVPATPTPEASGGRPFSRLRMVMTTTGWATRSGPAGATSLSLWRTTDGGLRWTDVTPRGDDNLRSDSILDGNTAWLAAPHPDGTVTTYRTVDGGETWTSSRLIAPEVTHGDPSLPIQIEIVDAQHGWLDVYGSSMWAGVSALFQTTDGGQTWTRLSSGIGEISGLLGFQSATTGWAGGARAGGALAAPSQPDSLHPGPLFVTRNGGQTWQYQPLPLPADEDASSIVEAVGPPQFSSDHDGSFAALLAPTARRNSVAIEVYQTHDAGHTWTTTPTFSLGLTSTGEAADFVGGRYGWVLDGSKLAMTDDGGQHWTTVTPTGLLPDPSGFLVEQLDFVDARTGWALVIAPHDPSTTIVLKTDDGGHTWKVVAQSSTPSFTTTVHEYHAVAFADAGHGCVAASDGVFCTADGGRTWRMGDAGTTSIVQMQFVSDTEGWLITRRPPAYPRDDNRLLHTTDGGATWQRVWP